MTDVAKMMRRKWFCFFDLCASQMEYSEKVTKFDFGGHAYWVSGYRTLFTIFFISRSLGMGWRFAVSLQVYERWNFTEEWRAALRPTTPM